jgi:predicted NBD/HSP70 family sugar kinase
MTLPLLRSSDQGWEPCEIAMISLRPSSSLPGEGRSNSFTRSKNVTKMNRVIAALHNRQMVLYLISTAGALSQLQIARLTHLQPSTVSYIIRELKAHGLVREGRALPSQRVGPKETLIEVNPAVAWSVGLTLDALGNKLCLMNAAGHIICQRTFSPELNTPAFLDSVPSQLAEVMTQYHLQMDESTFTVVSVPGVVNTVTGCVLNSTSLHLENYALAELLSTGLHCPVVVERNTVCGAYAERYLGCARGSEHFLYFLARPQTILDSGARQYSFGLAMIMNGEVYHGFNSAAGELHGELSLSAKSEQAFSPMGPFVAPKDIAAALPHLGASLANLVDLLDPEILVLCSDEELLTTDNLQTLRQTIMDTLISVPGRKLEILRSPLGTDGALYGASLMGLHHGLNRCLELSAAEG